MAKSLIELAFEFVKESKDKVSFAKIWAYVKEQAGLSDEEAAKKAGQFYTNILLDGRLVNLGNNEWDLRERNTFDKVHIDMKDVYNDVETSDDDNEENEENKEYDLDLSGNPDEEGKDGFGEDEDSDSDSNDEENL